MAGGGEGQYRENVQTFRKGVCSPLGPRLLPLKLWLLHLTKRTNLELWLFLTIPISSFGWNGEHFMQSLGHKGDDGGIQVASEMSQIFSLLLIWVKTDWTQPVPCNFTAEKEITSSINRVPPSHTYNQQKWNHFKRKMRAAISKMITKVRSFVDKAGI